MRISRKAAVTAVFAIALGAEARATTPVRVVTSIPPLAMLASELGGDRVLVHSLLPPGADPHTFELKPSDAATAASADVVLLLGSDIDRWLENALRGREGASVERLDAAAHGDEHAGHGHEGSEHDVHVWLDPVWVRERAIPPIHRALATADPAGAARYGHAARTMAEKMTDLEDDIRRSLALAATRHFLAWHPAWDSFAKRFDLHSVASLGDGEGREPSLRAMISAVRTGKAAGVRAVLVEPGVDPRQPRVLADELGVPLVTVDPVGSAWTSDRATYEQLMMFNTAAFTEALAVQKDDEGRPVIADPASKCGP